MALVDLTPPELEAYRPPSDEPEDFDDFWERTLAEFQAQRTVESVRERIGA